MPDPEEIEHLQAVLVAHCRRLRVLQEQFALLGRAQAPPHLVIGIEEAHDHIQHITATLRTHGIDVTGCPDDKPEHDPAALFSQATHAHIRGDLWEAKRLYEQVLAIAPFYPRAAERLAEVKRLIAHEAREVPLPRLPRRTRRNLSLSVLFLVLIATLCLLLLPMLTNWRSPATAPVSPPATFAPALTITPTSRSTPTITPTLTLTVSTPTPSVSALQ